MFRSAGAIAITAIATLALGGCAGMESTPALEKIVITAIPSSDDLTLTDRFGYLAELITETTGLPVEFFEAPNYAAVTEAISTGRAQIAHMDAFSYIAATNSNPELQLLAGSGRSAEARPGNRSTGITLLDSSVQQLDDLAGKSICYSDPASPASYLWPKAELGKLGIDADPIAASDVTGVFTGSLTSVALGVFNGDCEVGFVSDSTYLFIMPTMEAIDSTQFRVFWQSEEIPGIPLVAHPSIPADMIDEIKSVVLERANKDTMVAEGICTEIDECMFLTPGAWGYVPNEDAWYDVMRDFCRENDLEQCR